ncbi:MAG: hypothetical protein IPP27_18895 [Bacteroidetes bacterium]|nr:hypothetical protein [Bacteroidota bacterium]
MFLLKKKVRHSTEMLLQSRRLRPGASMVVVDGSSYSHYERCILVDDFSKTLQQLAAHHRSQLNFPFAITGSNGKRQPKN